MKKFIMVCPLQNTKVIKYNVGNNKKLKYDKKTRFPIIPVINTYAEKNETIKLIVICTEYSSTDSNLHNLYNEITELEKEKSITCEIVKIQLPYKETIDIHYKLFSNLIQQVKQDDELYACISYGSKPTINIVSMTLQYGHQVVKNTKVRCIVYGQFDFNEQDVDKQATIYDITSMFYMEQTLKRLAKVQLENPEEFMLDFLNMMSEGEDSIE